MHRGIGVLRPIRSELHRPRRNRANEGRNHDEGC
jgi:hypothetical protein